MCLIALMDGTTLLWWVDVVLKVAFGLGFVIFVHELGHFLVAKACGVKCEKFMIGFDIGGLKLSRRWGETEYGIGILPLGGYVKMLGQDDDPAHIAEQMKKSQVNEASGDAVPKIGPNGETYYIDRRSYLAKSVPQRIAIISAGVIMNVIFAFIFAVIAYGMGVPYLPCIISETVAGSPAWQAGLEPGDEIVKFGDQENPTFMQLKGSVTLGDLDNGIPCVVRRASNGELVDMTLRPNQEGGRLATIGVVSPLSLTLMEELPAIDQSPAARAKLIAPAENEVVGDAKFQGGDEIVRVGEQAIKNYRQYAAQVAPDPSKSLVFTVERPAKQMTDDVSTGAVIQIEEPRKLSFEVPSLPLRDFGLVMKIGPITSVRVDSPAAKAGIVEGDVIETVDGKPITQGGSGDEGWNPVTLPDYLRQAAVSGREVELTVERSARGESSGEPQTIRVTPVVPTELHSDIPAGAPMGADAIGIAYRIENEVQAIVTGTPAAESGIAVGETLTSATIIIPKDDEGDAPDPVTVALNADEANWPALIDAVQFAPAGTLVEFTVEGKTEAETRKVKLAPQAVEGAFVAPRGFVFKPIVRIRKAETFSEQIRYGWDETAESLTMVFRFLKKLGTQVPITALGGPVTIAKAAGYSASEGLPTLLIFLTMLSANLAVINFLPIPLLDGGHIVFLLYEWVRGRPANERFVVALHTVGFVFIVGLMLYVLALDVGLIDRGL